MPFPDYVPRLTFWIPDSAFASNGPFAGIHKNRAQVDFRVCRRYLRATYKGIDVEEVPAYTEEEIKDVENTLDLIRRGFLSVSRYGVHITADQLSEYLIGTRAYVRSVPDTDKHKIYDITFEPSSRLTVKYESEASQ